MLLFGRGETFALFLLIPQKGYFNAISIVARYVVWLRPLLMNAFEKKIRCDDTSIMQQHRWAFGGRSRISATNQHRGRNDGDRVPKTRAYNRSVLSKAASLTLCIFCVLSG